MKALTFYRDIFPKLNIIQQHEGNEVIRRNENTLRRESNKFLFTLKNTNLMKINSHACQTSTSIDDRYLDC